MSTNAINLTAYAKELGIRGVVEVSWGPRRRWFLEIGKELRELGRNHKEAMASLETIARDMEVTE